MTQLSIINHRQLLIGCITAIGGLTIIGSSNQTRSGTALAFGGSLLAISCLNKTRSNSLCNMTAKMIICGAIGLSVWKICNLGLVGLELFEKKASSPLNAAPIINAELSTSLNITGASLTPVFVYQSIPGSNLILMLGSYIANSLRISKHSSNYTKVVFIGLMLFKSR